MLSEMTRDWLKSAHYGLHFQARVQSQGGVQKCIVLSDHLNYNMLVIVKFLPNDTKKPLPTPALIT